MYNFAKMARNAYTNTSATTLSVAGAGLLYGAYAPYAASRVSDTPTSNPSDNYEFRFVNPLVPSVKPSAAAEAHVMYNHPKTAEKNTSSADVQLK